jgi:hypothetical protein
VPGETRRRSRGRGGGRLSGMISGGGGMWFRIMGRGVGLSTVMRNWTRGGGEVGGSMSFRGGIGIGGGWSIRQGIGMMLCMGCMVSWR